MKRFLCLAFFFFLLFACLPDSVAAAEQIKSYDVSVFVQSDGRIKVEESIAYEFDTPRHGIFRTIPYIKTNEDGKRYMLDISGIVVTDSSGNPYTFTTSRRDGAITYKIGDPDQMITGIHAYNISYVVSGALAYFPGHDELYWNAIGNDWDVPIESAKVFVSLPRQMPVGEQIRAQCFIGGYGTRHSDSCAAEAMDNAASFASLSPLSSGDGFTVVVGFPKDIVAVLEPTPFRSFSNTLLGKILLVGAGLFAVFWYLFLPIRIARSWWKYGRDPKPTMGETSAWFSAPKTNDNRDLTPAETGALVDERVDATDIFSTIVDLARRGFIKIVEVKPGILDLVKQKDWTVNKNLERFEKTLLSGIFSSSDTVHLASLNLAITVTNTTSNIYDALVANGFFPSHPDKIRSKYYVLAFLAFVSANPLLLLASMVFGVHMPRKTILGSQEATVGRSLRNFLVSQDKQLAFQAKNQMMFEKLLPYAIAFGVEKIWAKRFSGIHLVRPSWYESSSPGTFRSVAFANSLKRGASVSFASSIGSRSSSGFSSGFSGGGGSSGGGGGGGGGGSW